MSIAQFNFKCSNKATVSLLSAVSTTWLLGTAHLAWAEGYVSQTERNEPEACISEGTGSQACISGRTGSKEFVPVILGSRYVHSYAGGNYYYILEDKNFEDTPALAVKESSYSTGRDAYQPVRPESAPSQSLCGVLKPGDSGSGVACLQELLQKTGYFNGSITGYFGVITCDAVIAFQRDHGLYADGIVGPQTLEVLNRVAGSV
jgi:hypothetical protein